MADNNQNIPLTNVPREDLKNFCFRNKAKPDETDFARVFDSFIHSQEDGILIDPDSKNVGINIEPSSNDRVLINGNLRINQGDLNFSNGTVQRTSSSVGLVWQPIPITYYESERFDDGGLVAPVAVHHPEGYVSVQTGLDDYSTSGHLFAPIGANYIKSLHLRFNIFQAGNIDQENPTNVRFKLYKYLLNTVNEGGAFPDRELLFESERFSAPFLTKQVLILPINKSFDSSSEILNLRIDIDARREGRPNTVNVTTFFHAIGIDFGVI